MTSGAALKKGFKLARQTRATVWVLFLVNLGVAALASLPIYRGILSFTGHSLMSQELVSGFPLEWLTDFAINSRGSLERYATIITLFGLLSIPVNTVLAGGVLARFREPEESFSLGGFFHDACRYAWRLLRLMIIGLVCYWIVLRVLNQGLGSLLAKWTRDWQDDRQVFWVHLGVGLLVVLGVAFVNLVMDYARVKLVMDDGTGAAEAFLASLGFSVGRLRKAFVVYAVPSLCGLALLGVYRLVVPWTLIQQPLAVALLFIGQQLIMFGRYWFRVATWASEWAYYSGSK